MGKLFMFELTCREFADGNEPQFIAMRTTLEANMHQAHLFPPGRILWVLRDADLHPTNQLRTDEKGVKGTDKVRMFEVLDVERVFGQIVFSKNMLKYVSTSTISNPRCFF